MSNFIILNKITRETIEELKRKFLVGDYLNITEIIPNANSLGINNIKLLKISEEISDNQDLSKFYIKEHGINTLIHVNGTDIYDYYFQNGCYPPDLVCRCGLRIVNLHIIPIKKVTEDGVDYYFGSGAYHSGPCSKYFLKLLYSKDLLYRDSERYINEIYLKEHGITPCPTGKHPDLLDINGGTQTQKEFDNPSIKIIETNRIVLMPIKRYFQQVSK